MTPRAQFQDDGADEMDPILNATRGERRASGNAIAQRRRQRPALFWLRSIVLPLWIMLSATGCASPVLVDWSTETEMNTAGFNLYRGESPDGPFEVKVNEKLIPAAPDPMTGGKYHYSDNSAQAGKTYYYQLQEVEKTGGVNKYGPIAVRAGGFDWRLAVVLGVLAVGVVALWIFGGKRLKPAPPPEQP